MTIHVVPNLTLTPKQRFTNFSCFRSKTILLEIVPYAIIVACNGYIVRKLQKAERFQNDAVAEQIEMVRIM